MPKVLGKAIVAAAHMVAAEGERLEERPRAAARADIPGRDSSADRGSMEGMVLQIWIPPRSLVEMVARLVAHGEPCPASSIRGGHRACRPLAIAYPFELRVGYDMPSIRIKAVCHAVRLGIANSGPRILLASRQWFA
jgi:hypothetical protein